jgi:hypothetical protein
MPPVIPSPSAAARAFGAADDPSELHEFSSTARFSLLLVEKRHWLAAARAERAAD